MRRLLLPVLLGCLLVLQATGLRAQEACETLGDYRRMFDAQVNLFQSVGGALPAGHVRALRRELVRVDRAGLLWALRQTSLAPESAKFARLLAEAQYVAALVDRDADLARKRLGNGDTGALLMEVGSILARFDCARDVRPAPDVHAEPLAAPGGASTADWIDRLWLAATGLATLMLGVGVTLRAWRRRRRGMARRYGVSLDVSLFSDAGPRTARIVEISRLSAQARAADGSGLDVGCVLQIGLGGDWRLARIVRRKALPDGRTGLTLRFRRPLRRADLSRIVASGRPETVEESLRAA